MKRIVLLFISILLSQILRAQLELNDDSFTFRHDIPLSYKVSVNQNDKILSGGLNKMKLTQIFNRGANSANFNVSILDTNFSSNLIYLHITDSISNSTYSGEFVYYATDTAGNIDSATVRFNRIPLSPEVSPGETNKDNLVNHFDIFSLGLHFERSGNPRHTIDTNTDFVPRRVGDWFFQVGNIDAKYADIDGNGKIDNRDLDKLKLNIGNITGIYNPRLSPASAVTTIEIKAEDTISFNGDSVLVLSVEPGGTSHVSTYGVGYSLSVQNLNSTASIDTFYPNYKIVEANPWNNQDKSKILTLNEAISKPNHRNIAYCQTDLSNDSMKGGFGIVEIVVTEILIGLTKPTDIARLKINLSEVSLIDNNYNLIPISPISKTIYLKKAISSLSTWVKPLTHAYPTMIEDKLILEKHSVKNEPYAIFNSIGQEIQKGILSSPKTILDNIQWSTGIYYLKFNSNAEVIRLQKR